MTTMMMMMMRMIIIVILIIIMDLVVKISTKHVSAQAALCADLFVRIF